MVKEQQFLRERNERDLIRKKKQEPKKEPPLKTSTAREEVREGFKEREPQFQRFRPLKQNEIKKDPVLSRRQQIINLQKTLNQSLCIAGQNSTIQNSEVGNKKVSEGFSFQHEGNSTIVAGDSKIMNMFDIKRSSLQTLSQRSILEDAYIKKPAFYFKSRTPRFQSVCTSQEDMLSDR